MSIDEGSRHALHTRLEQVLGPEEALTLMELTPPLGWGDMATKRDLNELSVVTKRDMDEFRGEFKRDLDVLRVATKRDLDEFRGDFNDFRGETKEEFKRVWTELGYIRNQIDSHFRTTIFSMFTLMIGLAGLVFVVARLAA